MRIEHLFLFCTVFSGCGSSHNAGSDSATPSDGRGATRDGGAGGDASGLKPFRYVTDAITLPPSKSFYGADLNGDGKKDNQLGNIVSALTSINIDLQAQQDAAIKVGDGLKLFSFSTIDTT